MVNRAFYRGETTILMKNGVAVARIAPVAPGGVAASEALARWRTIATAIARAGEVATLNTRDFRRVPSPTVASAGEFLQTA